MVPRKDWDQVMPASWMACTPPATPRVRGVAPEKPSTAVQTASPEIWAG